jgi:nitrogen fixation protein NifX
VQAVIGTGDLAVIHSRRLDLIERSSEKGITMKVAFASSDKIHIDQHFGFAEHFVIWEIQPDDARLAGLVQIEATGDDDADKIAARIEALRDCVIVYVTQIGGPAAARLVSRKIHPVKSKGNETISDVLAKLQTVLRDNPPPWLRRSMKQDKPAASAES